MNTFRTAFGRFSPDGREYVITTPRTPRPWVNVVSNGDYGFVVSQTGSGYSWRTHAQLNRLTRWEQDLIRDDWGKYLYLRDERGNFWSAGWKPVCHDPDAYVCRHGIGYTVITSEQFGIVTELLFFVPNDEPVELWRLTVRNRSRRRRTLDLLTYCEWGLGQAPDWHREFHRSFIETRYDTATGSLLATKRLWEVPTERGHWNTDWPFVAFHAASVRPASFETDKEAFLGMYGSPARPHAASRTRLGNHAGNWLDPVASLHHRVTLAPGGERTIWYSLGCANSLDQARAVVQRFQSAPACTEALTDVHARWNRILDAARVCTPDDAMNLMENTWLKYQAISARLWARTGYYQTGGAFGFRDQLQDSQIWLPIDPQRTCEQLRLHARHQFQDGSVYHWWHPLSEIGLRNQISDNLLWLPFVMTAYLRETGDGTSLDIREPFVDDPAGGTLYDHCCRAIERALQRRSDRGLPLIGGGDWNDGLSAVGLDMKGESVWLGHFLHRILIDFAEVAEDRGDRSRASRYRSEAAGLRTGLNTTGWDGSYYWGATKDSGEKIGSRGNREGRLWLNPQTWAVIGGVADAARAGQVMDVVERELETEIGPLLLAPAYTVPDRMIGYLTRYSAGMRENGGVYTHGATWAVIAAAMLGRGETAFRIYSRLNPVNRGKRPTVYRAEPYVTAGNIEGPGSPFFGRGGWTWYSGSAAWLFAAGMEWILGVRPSRAGLVVDPCIPSDWPEYAVTRMFRGATYRITVRNPHGAQTGVEQVLLDGRPCAEHLGPREKCLPVCPAGTIHDVLVVLGPAAAPGRKK